MKIGTVKDDGEVVNVYSKPPDKEAIAKILNRHFGRPRIEIDQRLRTEVEISPEDYMRALRKAQEISSRFMLPSQENEELPSERQLTSPTREESHDPDVDTPFREETMSPTDILCDNSDHDDCSGRDSAGNPPTSEDRGPETDESSG